MQNHDEATDLAGYRLIERISSGERATVFRAVESRTRSGPRSDAPSRVVIVKRRVVGPEPPGAASPTAGRAYRAWRREADILADGPVSAMPRLIQLGRTPEGAPFTVMSVCGDESLAHLLAPEALEAGRRPPVGLAGRLTALVAELHAAGVAHGALDAEAVMIDADGNPSVVGFGRARIREERGFDRACAADLERLAVLTDRLAGLASVPSAEWAASEPSAAVASEPGGGASAARAVAGEWEWRAPDDESLRAPGELGLVETLDPAWAAVCEFVRLLRRMTHRRVRGLVSERRRRVLLFGAAGLVAAVVAGSLLLPGAGPGPEAARRGTLDTDLESSSPAPSELPTPIGRSEPAASQISAESSAPPAGVGQDAPSGGVTTEDPVEAAATLLSRRAGCLTAGEPECIDALTEWGAPARAADRELLRAGVAADPLAGLSGLNLVQLIGGVAVVGATGTTKPVSLLLMRGETGWVLRSYA